MPARSANTRIARRSLRDAAATYALAVLLPIAVPAAEAQLFLASHPSPAFAIGPLFVRAHVSPALGPIAVDVLWGLVVPPTRSALGMEQDLYLLWPGPVMSDRSDGGSDPSLLRYVEARGFSVVGAGRLPLFEQNLYPTKADEPAERIASGAPFVTFARHGLRPLGLASAATYVRIPWTAKLVNPTWLVKLQLTVNTLLKPERANWIQNAFWGRRYLLSVGFNDVNEQALFSMYLEHRDRVVPLANDPSQLLATFADADRLTIDEVFPQSSNRKRSEAQENTEVVSLFLNPSEGRTPQVLTVRFGYFSGLQTWAPILIPILFFVLGRATGPLVERVARRVGASVADRLRGASRERADGVVLSRETLERVVPGETTYEEVIDRCGREVEEQEQFGSPDRRTLIYRGRRIVPLRRRVFAWLSTVSRWDIEHHEVEIHFEHGRVRDVQVRVRRARLPRPAPS